MTRAFRLGLIQPLEAGDPRVMGDFANTSLRWQQFECAYRPKPEGNGLEAVLLEHPLRREPDQDGHAVLSAGVVAGRKFADGTPVTAERVVASLRKLATLVEKAEIGIAEGRVRFVLKRPNARFDHVLANHANPIVLETPGGLVGTGPFLLAETNASGARLVRNPHYAGPVEVEELRATVYPPDADGEPRTLIEAVNAGEVDYTDHVPYPLLSKLQNVRKVSNLGYCTCSLFFNTERPLLKEARVRTALAQAIDRRAVAAACFANPLAFTAQGLMPPALGGGADGFLFAPDAARPILEQAGLTRSAPLRLLPIPLRRPYLPDPAAATRVIVSHLGALGVGVEVATPRDLREFTELAARADYDLALLGWIPDNHDPLEYLEVHLASWSIPARSWNTFIAANLSRLRSDAIDEALRACWAEASPHAWQEVLRRLNSEAPLLPLMYGPEVVVLSWRVARRPSSFRYRPFFAEMALSS